MIERRLRLSGTPTVVVALLGLAAALLPQVGLAQNLLSAGPVIRVDARTFDFGQVQQSNHYSHKFTISNGGTAPLAITKIDVSCGCTAAIASDSLLAPGQSTTLEITFSSKDFEGEQSKGVTVFTNDPAEPRLDLLIKADVKPFVRVSDRMLDFTVVQRGEKRTLVAYLEADAGLGFAVSEVGESADEYVTWNIVPMPGKEGTDSVDKVRVEATIRQDAPLGRFLKRVPLTLKHPRRTSESLDVRGLLYSYFLIEKPVVNFLPLKPDKVASRTVEIESDGSKPYKILSVVSPSEHFVGKLEAKGKITLLHLEFRAPGQPGKFHEDIKLVTDDPAQPEILLKVNATVRP